MHAHIDVFINDWTNSIQRLIARVRLSADEAIEVEVYPGHEQYRSVILEPISDGDGGWLSPDTDPVEFYKQLPEAMNGSYLGATQSHNGNCAFLERHEIPFQRVGA